MSRERVMALCFLLGSVCFFVAPFALYTQWVGPIPDASTYFAGSIPFTVGGLLQALIALKDRRNSAAGRWLWHSAWVQFVGTVFFNLTTLRAITLTPENTRYDALVWRPNALGSVCFLISGVILYLASPRRGIRLARQGPGWWEPEINLLGCGFFAISAVAGFAEPRTGSLVGPRVTDWTTSLGAACFLACAVATLISGWTFKSPRLRRWRGEVSAEIVHLRAFLP